MWSQSGVPGGGRGSEGVDSAPQAESRRHDDTIFVPEEVRRYCGRYDGTTPVPSGGMMVSRLYPQETVPPLYLEVVRL